MNIALTSSAHRTNQLSTHFARFVRDLGQQDIPPDVLERGRLLLLDAVGVALAAGSEDFTLQALNGIVPLSDGGSVPIIGLPHRLGARDAALVNGLLIHGLDFDDTFLDSLLHPTASLLPTVLAVGHKFNCPALAILHAYIGSLEVLGRLGAIAGPRLVEAGQHPTSVIGIFGATLAAGKLMGLTVPELVMAQGLALAMASGTIGSAAVGASNKRLHPGLAAQSAITAATLAKSGMMGHPRPYDGPSGLFRNFEQSEESITTELNECIETLGTLWRTRSVAIKPIPACHHNHAVSDAAVALRNKFNIRPDDITNITALVPEGIIHAVCEPIETKRKPVNSYSAQFSLPYVVAASFIRGRFGFEELEPESINDPAILELAAKVSYQIDGNTTYPVHRTGELIVTLKEGTTFRHREAINRGHPDRPLSSSDIEAKFYANAGMSRTRREADQIAGAVLTLGSAQDGRLLIDTICGAV